MDLRRAVTCAVVALAPIFFAESAHAADPILRQGSSGSSVVRLQDALEAKGYDTGGSDGIFGSLTKSAVVAFQRSRGLAADGVVGPLTWSALLGSGGPATPPPTGVTFTSRGTGYYPANTRLEGGFFDRRGNRLQTLQDFLAGRVSWVSVAMDVNAFPYGQKLRIAELEAKYGRAIEFRVVDTGGAFRGKGRTRIDICTGGRTASLDPTINGTLHCTIVR